MILAGMVVPPVVETVPWHLYRSFLALSEWLEVF